MTTARLTFLTLQQRLLSARRLESVCLGGTSARWISARRNAKRKTSGFTLIELMVVVGLIGLITTFALVNFTGAEGRRIESGLRQVHSHLSLARQFAVTHRQDSVLVIDNINLNRFFVAAIQENQMTDALTDWIDLPAGVYFDNDTALKDNLFTVSSNEALSPPDYLDPPPPGNPIRLRYNARGEVVTTNQEVSPRIYLAIGFLDGSSLTRDNDDLDDLVLTRRLTGLPEIHRFVEY